MTTRYRTIVADPPWQVDQHAPAWGYKERRSGRRPPYDVMTVDAIERLPVEALADDDAHLYLWTINRHIEAAYGIARAWGFRPSTLLTWCKSPKGLGYGGAYVHTTEHVLFARRGRLAHKSRVDSTWWHWKRGRPSAKPEQFLDMVERVSPGPYLELFARRRRLGWDVWGDEVDSDVMVA